MKTKDNRNAKAIKRLLKAVQVWCADPTSDSRHHEYRIIRKSLNSKVADAALSAIMMLPLLANWDAIQGCNRVLEGNRDGWASLAKVFWYRWWRMRSYFEPGDLQQAGHCLAHGIVMNQKAQVKWLAEAMSHDLTVTKKGLWTFSPFALFVLQLWGMQEGRPIEATGVKVENRHIYDAILDAWHDIDALGEALLRACDYHLKEAFDSHGYPEFVWPPYDIFPVDILAIQKVRQQQGLPMPNIDHPLLKTPLAQFPPPEYCIEPPPDEWLSLVINKAKEQGFLPKNEAELYTFVAPPYVPPEPWKSPV